VVQKAGMAAPAVAVVGALAAAPQIQQAAQVTPAAFTSQQVTHAHLDAAIRPVRVTTRSYTVRPGDTLSGIAQRFYGRSADWPALYQANRSRIRNPDLIYVGQVLSIPAEPTTSHATTPAKPHTGDAVHATGTTHTTSTTHTTTTTYVPKHSKPATTSLQGTLSCGGLEALWRSAGGASWAEVTAASIAMAESGGRQYATGSAGERGYWQINPVNGSLSTYNAYGNARSAVIMSRDGTNWHPWTTWVDGAYRGRC
jgi:LysM repeat protein